MKPLIRGKTKEKTQKKIGMVSLGCPKNLTDSEVLMGYLKSAGHDVVANVADADTIVVNTCSFLQASVEESMETIREMARLKQEGRCKRLVVSGCLVERYREGLKEQLPEVDGFFGSGAYEAAVQYLAVPSDSSHVREAVMEVGNGAALYSHEVPRIKATYPWTAYVKIAEGCDHTCAFCTIPSIRGVFRSRPVESILHEVRGLVARGVKEVVLVAQDSTMYGFDLHRKPSLDVLLTRLATETEIQWVRVLYGYPSQVTEGVIQSIETYPALIPYFDMPIQHVSDRVLRYMKRGYGGVLVRKLVQRFRRENPRFALRSTVIVGFPGEAEEDIRELIDFMEEMEFDHLGAFMYSNEPGTTAHRLEGQVAASLKTERYHRVMQAQQRIAKRRTARWVGEQLEVLIEEKISSSPFTYRGRSFRDAPEIDGSVMFRARAPLPLGTFTSVQIEEAQAYDLIGSAML